MKTFQTTKKYNLYWIFCVLCLFLFFPSDD